MSSRKESLKKSLGITEYPWSSDDEDSNTPQVVEGVNSLRRHSGEPRPSIADIPGTSGVPSTQSLASTAPAPSAPSRRSISQQAKNERDLFWSWLNNPPHTHKPSTISVSRLNDAPLSCVSRPLGGHVPNAQDILDRSTDRAYPAGDIQGILAFKKLTRSLNNMRQKNRSNTSFYSAVSSRSNPGPIRNPIVTPPTPSLMASNVLERFGRPYPSQYRNQSRSSLITFGRSANSAPPAEAGQAAWRARPPRSAAGAAADDLTHAAPPQPNVDITHSDDETQLATASISLPAPVNDSNRETTETVEEPSHNTSAGGMSLEEEIVELDAPDDTDANANADIDMENVDANAIDTSETTPNTSAVEEASQQSHGVKRKRDAAEENNQPYSVKEFNQSLLRLLECPVCLEWMEPPISQCRRGHLVCSRCRARLASCPVCRTMFSSVRNRAMEGVAEMLRYPCRHGCGREVRLRRRAAHESSCAARNYHCPAPACADRHPMPHDHLAQHFQSKHLPMLKIGRKHKFSMKVNAEQHDNWLIMALDEYFHLRVDVDIHTWGVIVYVAYIGPKCKADNFTYMVSVDGQHNSRKLIYARETHSDLENSSLNVSRQDCFHLTLDQALNFLRFKNRHCEPEKFLDFNVEITKCEVLDSAKEESDS